MHMPSNHSAHAILGVLWCACRGPFGGYRFVIVPLSSQDYLNDCWLYWAVMAPECPNLYRLLRGDRKQHARSLAALALGRELVADMVTEAVAELRFAVLLVAAVGTDVERRSAQRADAASRRSAQRADAAQGETERDRHTHRRSTQRADVARSEPTHRAVSRRSEPTQRRRSEPTQRADTASRRSTQRADAGTEADGWLALVHLGMCTQLRACVWACVRAGVRVCGHGSAHARAAP